MDVKSVGFIDGLSIVLVYRAFIQTECTLLKLLLKSQYIQDETTRKYVILLKL